MLILPSPKLTRRAPLALKIGDGLSFASDSIALMIVIGCTYNLWLEKKRADAGDVDAMDRLVLPGPSTIIMPLPR